MKLTREDVLAVLDPLGGETLAWQSDYDLNPDWKVPEGVTLKRAAVLVPLIERPDGYTVLLTRRSAALRRQPGQIAFPGGSIDPGETPAEAALREAWEEIGLESGFVEVVGQMGLYETVTGYAVQPIVGFVKEGFTLKLNEAEVDAVFEPPLDFLMDEANSHKGHFDTADGLRRYFWEMPYGEWRIWGMTAGILRGLLHRLKARELVRS